MPSPRLLCPSHYKTKNRIIRILALRRAGKQRERERERERERKEREREDRVETREGKDRKGNENGVWGRNKMRGRFISPHVNVEAVPD